MSRFYFIAAEPSGDMLAAEVANGLGAANIVGAIGGPNLAKLGFESPINIADLTVFGFIEALGAAWRIKRLVKIAADHVIASGADVVVMVDSWGFMALLAKALRQKKPELTLIKLVGPQVWATRAGRAKTLANLFDGLIGIHPFEAPYYSSFQLPFVAMGNPALQRFERPSADALAKFKEANAPDEGPILLVLPGSRKSEITHVLPIFEETCRQLKAQHPYVQILVSATGSVANAIHARAAHLGFEAKIIGDEDKQQAFALADVALACSGTVTSELAAALLPMVVAYRFSFISYIIAKRLYRPKYFTLINVRVEQAIVPEFLQDGASPAILLASLLPLFDPKSPQRAAQLEGLNAFVAAELGDVNNGSSQIAAQIAAKALSDQFWKVGRRAGD